MRLKRKTGYAPSCGICKGIPLDLDIIEYKRRIKEYNKNYINKKELIEKIENSRFSKWNKLTIIKFIKEGK